jgi:hypothetical protein
MKLITPIVTICALLAPAVLSADTFEGTLTMTITSSSSKNGPQALNMSLKDGNMRTDIQTSRGTMSAIMDMKNQQMIILMPQQRMYMVQPMRQPAAQQGQYQQYQGQAQAAGNPPTLVDTGVKETILGYECTKYTATNDKGTAEIWVTDQLGTFTGLFHGGAPGRPNQPAPDWENALKGKAFFPMKVVGTNDKGTFSMEVTAINKTSLPDSLFAPPDGWQKFDLGSIMGGGGFPGGFGRPPGGSN